MAPPIMWIFREKPSEVSRSANRVSVSRVRPEQRVSNEIDFLESAGDGCPILQQRLQSFARLIARAQGDRTGVLKIVIQIERADYEGDRARLKRLYGESPAKAESANMTARFRYWRGFALWRRAIHGFNDNVDAAELLADLKQADDEFSASAGKRIPGSWTRKLDSSLAPACWPFQSKRRIKRAFRSFLCRRGNWRKTRRRWIRTIHACFGCLDPTFGTFRRSGAGVKTKRWLSMKRDWPLSAAGNPKAIRLRRRGESLDS